VKHHNPKDEDNKSDEQKVFAVVGTFPLREIRRGTWTWFGHTLQFLRLGGAGRYPRSSL